MKPKNDSVIIRTEELEKERLLRYRHEFDALCSRVPNFSRKNLIQFDTHFLTAVGKDDIRNCKEGKAGVDKTRRVVEALRKYVDSLSEDRKRLDKMISRQKIHVPV